MTKEIKHFLSVADLSSTEIREIFSSAKNLKEEFKTNGHNGSLLSNKQMVMLFEKPSLRTKLSFAVGWNQLGGGEVVYFSPAEVDLGKREAISDVAKVCSSMTDVVVARVFSHKSIEELAQYSSVPVINALSDFEHPCQTLTDLFTIWEVKGKLEGLKIGYVGDADNNVAHSLCLGSAMMNMEFRCASPKGYHLDSNIVEIASGYDGTIFQTEDPKDAVTGADIVVTDTWISMGDTDEERRMKLLRPYQVNEELMRYAKRGAVFLHCLPAHRGEEVTADVIDGLQSVVFQEAENRLHVQKALLLHILGLYKS